MYVREITERNQLLLRGPATGIQGIHAQPLWFYLLALGYTITNGHPFGGVIIVIFLNFLATTIIAWQINKHISTTLALLIGASLQVMWPFFDTSRWAFNPFPIVILTLITLLLLVEFFNNNRKFYFFALIPILLAFNFEVAAASALMVFYIFIGIWSVWKKRLGVKLFFISAFVIPTLILLPIIFEFTSVFIKTRIWGNILPGTPLGTFSGTNFVKTIQEFAHLIAQSVIPQSLASSLVVIISSFLLWFRTPRRNLFTGRFFFLTTILFCVSFAWFSLNKGWRDWHTLYLPPLIFISLLLLLFNIKKIIAIPLITIIIFAQSVLFTQRYVFFKNLLNDPGIMANQIKVLNWIYTNSENNGFDAYVFTPTGYDYPYQYLFWWYGKKTYGHIPCEYAIHPFPLQEKWYVPNAIHYSQPTLGCNKFVFLIIEPHNNSEGFSKWMKNYENTNFVEEKKIGAVSVQKRIKN